MSIWDKFDEKIDLEGLKEDVKDAQENGGSFEEVPFGTYEVKVEKMELKESKKGDPMVSIWFKVLEGKHKNGIIFYNQLVSQGFGIHMALEFLRSMEIKDDIQFESYGQFDVLLVLLEEESKKLEFALEYGQNNKGFNTYKITDVFDA